MVRRVFLVLICAFLCISCLGCDLIYKVIQPEGAEEKDLLGDIPPFSYNPVVEEVQELLSIYGYHVGAIDGKLGPKTRESIAAFQKEQGLKVTRFVDYTTWERLTIFIRSGLIVDGEPNIKAVQIALEAAGFPLGKIDGKMGPKTIEALKSFQREEGLKVDGIIGFMTLKALVEYLVVE